MGCCRCLPCCTSRSVNHRTLRAEITEICSALASSASACCATFFRAVPPLLGGDRSSGNFVDCFSTFFGIAQRRFDTALFAAVPDPGVPAGRTVSLIQTSRNAPFSRIYDSSELHRIADSNERADASFIHFMIDSALTTNDNEKTRDSRLTPHESKGFCHLCPGRRAADLLCLSAHSEMVCLIG
jgi:hypothetical protein